MKLKSLKICHLNIRSQLPKFRKFHEFVLSSDFDVMCLSETWLHPDWDLSSLNITGFNLNVCSRTSRGGGVAIYTRDVLKVSVINSYSCIDSEYLWLGINSQGIKLAVGCFYRQPRGNFNNFLQILEDSYSIVNLDYMQTVCLGDFNVNMLNLNNLSVLKIIDTFEVLGLKQLVNKPTRITKKTNTLIDYIVVSENLRVLGSEVTPCDISDHQLLECQLDLNVPANNPVPRFVRCFSSLNYEEFNRDLRSLSWHSIYYIPNIDDKVNLCNSYIAHLFDVHAPRKLIKFTKKRSLPYITDNIKLLMSLRDKAYTKAKKSGTDAHWRYYKDLRNYTSQAVIRERRAYIESKFSMNNSRQFWKELSILNIARARGNSLPVHLCNVQDINKNFLKYVIDIVDSFDGLDPEILNQYRNNVLDNTHEPLVFKFVNEDVIKAILISIKTNATGIDDISIRMIKMCFPVVIPVVTHIVNECLRLSVFPSAWKVAKVLPLNKIDIPQSYSDLRPLSILPVLSKVLERVMCDQLNEYISKYKLLPEKQSGFRAGHSCATTLLNVVDDILNAHDDNKVTVMVQLDFSKAFETISHDMLLAKLHYFGASAQVIDLLHSYLGERLQCVSVDGVCSDSLLVNYGVPQGSIMGPTLYSLYTADFHKVLKHCNYHFYADDTQLYYSFDVENLSEAKVKITQDVKALIEMAGKHFLKINFKKSSILVFGPRVAANLVRDNLTINIDGNQLPVVMSAKNLGVSIDSDLSFSTHIKNLLKKSYFKLKLLYTHRHFFNCEIKKLLCDTLILSNFTYCCQVYGFCTTKFWLTKIQTMQNSCLRFIYSIRRRQHISHKLKTINWLNMQNRFHLQISVLIHKVLIEKKPSYLHRKIKFRTDVHNLNLRNKHLICCPQHRLQVFKNSFTYLCFKIYNSIPKTFKSLGIRSFKVKYKAFLFSLQCSA